MSARDEKLLRLVEKLNDPNEKLSEDELTSLLTKTYTLCRVPPLQDPNVPYSTADFEGIAREAEVNLTIVLKLLGCVRLQNGRNSQGFSHVFLKYLFVTCLMAACEYCDEEWEWSSPGAASISKNIVSQVCELFDCNTMPELFSANSPRDSSLRQSSCGKETPLGSDLRSEILKAILQKLSEDLRKDNWRQRPSLKMSYWWILRNIGKDDLGDHLAYLLPPALFIADDWENRNKLLGLQCLQHILDNTVGSELRWYGRAAVIYDAMKPMLYTREPEVLRSLYPAITQVAQVLEADPAKSGKLQPESTLDFILQQLLQEMAHEQKLSLRAVYASALPQLVKALNLYSVRWSKELMDVCGDYLATFEGSAAQDRINILKALQSYVKACWPQIHRHARPLLTMAVRLLYDVTEDDAGVDAESVEVITQEVQGLVVLLYAAAPTTVRDLCKGLQNVEVHPQCRLLLQDLHSVTQGESHGCTG